MDYVYRNLALKPYGSACGPMRECCLMNIGSRHPDGQSAILPADSISQIIAFLFKFLPRNSELF